MYKTNRLEYKPFEKMEVIYMITRRNFYKATTSENGLEEGRSYFVDEERMITLCNGERMPVSMLKGKLKPIPVYDGTLKEEWDPEKWVLFMEVNDFMKSETMLVMVWEAHEKGKGLVLLAEIPGELELVQIDVPNLWVS